MVLTAMAAASGSAEVRGPRLGRRVLRLAGPLVVDGEEDVQHAHEHRDTSASGGDAWRRRPGTTAMEGVRGRSVMPGADTDAAASRRGFGEARPHRDAQSSQPEVHV